MPEPLPSIVHALLAAADRTPEQPALWFEGAVWSYARLAETAARWGGAYRAWGLAPGDRVALFLENGPTFVAAYLGAHLAGGIVVLVNTQYRQVELRHLFTDAEVRLAVTDAAHRPELARVEADVPTLEGVVLVDTVALSTASAPGARRPRDLSAEAFLAAARTSEFTRPPASQVAVIAYTSGTTGRSKGAMLTHANLAANSVAVTSAWGWTAADRLLLTLPLFHVHGLGVGLHGSLVTGGTVDLRRRFEARDVFDTLLRGETTMFFGVPTMYTRLIAEAERRPERPPPLRLYVSGSAPLSPQTFAAFEAHFGQRILERYGMTETIMNLTNPYAGERRPGTVGQPFPGQEARIVDLQTRQPIRDEQLGEIQVRGPHVFPGYWRRPEATAEAFDADGWFNTGDLGWRSADGYFTISGRARELIITGGYNVYPREVEEVLLAHPGVAEAAVVGLPDPEFGEQVVAVIVPRPTGDGEAAPAVDALLAFCREQLASYKKPRQVFFVSELPRNALGKIQKHLLREQVLAAAADAGGTDRGDVDAGSAESVS